jgi:aspartyl-tRNA synthetase
MHFSLEHHHGGLAGLDRLVAILGGQETIRDFIAFPKITQEETS